MKLIIFVVLIAFAILNLAAARPEETETGKCNLFRFFSQTNWILFRFALKINPNVLISMQMMKFVSNTRARNENLLFIQWKKYEKLKKINKIDCKNDCF